jgi:hypothetical protein
MTAAADVAVLLVIVVEDIADVVMVGRALMLELNAPTAPYALLRSSVPKYAPVKLLLSHPPKSAHATALQHPMNGTVVPVQV